MLLTRCVTTSRTGTDIREYALSCPFRRHPDAHTLLFPSNIAMKEEVLTSPDCADIIPKICHNFSCGTIDMVTLK